jgi:hypothetical protein
MRKLIAKLTATEDQFVERKPRGNRGGWLRTVVAFANSTPIDYPAVLFIGVDDKGNIMEGLRPEEEMKSFSDYIAEHAWPPIYSAPRILDFGGRTCIAVIVPGSEARPHFAGKAYVRTGTQTKDASEDQFAKMIADRNGKARKLLEFRGRLITLETLRMKGTPHTTSYAASWILSECNQFYVTLTLPAEPATLRSIPLAFLEISYDDKHNQLAIVIEQ